MDMTQPTRRQQQAGAVPMTLTAEELDALEALARRIDEADRVEETNPGMYIQSTYAREDFGHAAANHRKALLSAARRGMEIDDRRREMRRLLTRLVKYVREDRAQTPGVTRLARLTDQVADYLNRTRDPADILRGAGDGDNDT
jgi:hypothetical protein